MILKGSWLSGQSWNMSCIVEVICKSNHDPLCSTGNVCQDWGLCAMLSTLLEFSSVGVFHYEKLVRYLARTKDKHRRCCLTIDDSSFPHVKEDGFSVLQKATRFSGFLFYL